MPGQSPATKAAPKWGQDAAVVSRQILHNRRPNRLRDGHRQLLPDSNGQLVLWILRIQIRHLSAVREPVVPVQRERPGPPLFLEPVRPAIESGASEIKLPIAFCAGIP